MPTHWMGRSHKSRCAGLTIGSIERTASVQSSNIQTTCPQTAATKLISDFRRDHATSPCLSTTLGNRKLPDDERWPSDCGCSCSVRRKCRACGSRAVDWFSINRCKRHQAQCGVSICKAAKTGQIIFSRSSRKRCTGSSLIAEITRKQAEKRAFSIHGRDADGLAGDFMRVCRIRWRKAPCHGHLRARRARDPKSLDGE